jgi:hypothetical protein
VEADPAPLRFGDIATRVPVAMWAMRHGLLLIAAYWIAYLRALVSVGGRGLET